MSVRTPLVVTALLIDDDDAFRTTLQGALRRRGVRARTAATLDEGLVALEDEAPNLVTLDHRMPRRDGLSGVADIRRLVPSAAIVFLTGYGDIPLAVAAVKEGADTLLTKPLDADRLLREAGVILARDRVVPQPRPPHDVFNLDALERDTIRRALTQAGGVVASAAKLLGIDRRTLQRKLRRRS